MTTEELNALIAQAEGGDVAAMNQLGQIYGGNEFKDFEKAFYWHKKAAELGNVNSMSNLGGWCYLQGNGTEKNIPLADEWLKKSVENGWVWTWAFNELANIFANDAQYKDLSKAFYWYSKSAEAGDALGMSNLGGWCYLWGNGVERDVDKAIYWLTKAADECGDIWSMNKLTYIYGELEGYTNNEQAAKWFLALIQKDCDPNSGVYENTGYNKGLYEKVKNAILNSSSENDMSSLLGSSSGGSLLGNSIYFTSSNAKSYINQAEEAIKQNIIYKEKEARKKAEEEERRKAEEARKKAEIEERKAAEEEERKKAEEAVREAIEEEKRKIKIIEKSNTWGPSEFYSFRGSFVIPDGTRHIGKSVFKGCTGLTSIEIPNSVTSIGNSAFEGCISLTSVVIPDSVKEISISAFEGCTSLTSVIIPKGIEVIERDAFKGCTGLTSVVIPDGVKEIRISAFEGCTGLTSVIIPDSVISIFGSAFEGCIGLTSLTIPSSVTYIGGPINGCWLGNGAFEGCTGLTSVIIPDSVTDIGENAFEGCASLTSVTFLSSSTGIRRRAFYDSPIKSIIVPKGTKQRYENMEGLKGLEDKIVEE